MLWKGAAVAWLLVAAAHAAAHFAVLQPALTDSLRTTAMSLAYGILPLGAGGRRVPVERVGGLVHTADEVKLESRIDGLGEYG